jgi:hypothetical protein
MKVVLTLSGGAGEEFGPVPIQYRRITEVPALHREPVIWRARQLFAIIGMRRKSLSRILQKMISTPRPALQD